MKKLFDVPAIDIERFDLEDVIATSGNDTDLGENELPPSPA